ncbi:phosphatidylserine decarboxylase family protein [bacterium]|nr:phosphatidylserine decarboxylase family protein [bacterium]
MRIVKDGWKFIIAFLILAVILFFFWKIGSFFLLSFAALILFFFRDPERKVPQGKDLILSPADGKIIDISEVEEENFLRSRVKVVRIFMSVFNVHVQRSPVKGKVEWIKYEPGKFMAAYKKEASGANESNLIGIQKSDQPDSNRDKIMVKQIAGRVARRICCWCKEGDNLIAGQRIGMIRFGSRADVYLPQEVEIRVKKGDRVVGGETLLGKFPS